MLLFLDHLFQARVIHLPNLHNNRLNKDAYVYTLSLPLVLMLVNNLEFRDPSYKNGYKSHFKTISVPQCKKITFVQEIEITIVTLIIGVHTLQISLDKLNMFYHFGNSMLM